MRVLYEGKVMGYARDRGTQTAAPSLSQEKKMTKPNQNRAQFSARIRQACVAYSKARQEGATQQWAVAAKAYAIKEVCAAESKAYQDPAMALCDVSRATISTDVMAEELRRELGLKTKDLPLDSVSSFYALHRARNSALRVAGSDGQKKAVAEKKISEVAEQIARREITVRGVRAAFKAEFEEDNKKRRPKGTPEPPKAEEVAPELQVEKLDAEALKAKIEAVNAPAGMAFGVVSVTPHEDSVAAIAYTLQQKEVAEEIAKTYDGRGPVWVLLDMDAAAKRLTVALETAEEKSVKKAKPDKPRKEAVPKKAA